jgi:hypothetical protein
MLLKTRDLAEIDDFLFSQQSYPVKVRIKDTEQSFSTYEEWVRFLEVVDLDNPEFIAGEEN